MEELGHSFSGAGESELSEPGSPSPESQNSAGKQENNWGTGDQCGNVGQVMNEQRASADSDRVAWMPLNQGDIWACSGQESCGQWQRWAWNSVYLPSMLIGSRLNAVLPSLATGLSGSSSLQDDFEGLTPNRPPLIQAISFSGLTSLSPLERVFKCFPRATGSSLVVREEPCDPYCQSFVGPS